MTADICVCGHLEQTHEGACHAPCCSCPRFDSEDGFEQLATVIVRGVDVTEHVHAYPAQPYA